MKVRDRLAREAAADARALADAKRASEEADRLLRLQKAALRRAASHELRERDRGANDGFVLRALDQLRAVGEAVPDVESIVLRERFTTRDGEPADEVWARANRRRCRISINRRGNAYRRCLESNDTTWLAAAICHEHHHVVYDSGEPEAWAAMAGVFRKLGNDQMAAWAEGRAELELLDADR